MIDYIALPANDHAKELSQQQLVNSFLFVVSIVTKTDGQSRMAMSCQGEQMHLIFCTHACQGHENNIPIISHSPENQKNFDDSFLSLLIVFIAIE
ncbi:MAG: hypothetical protein KKD01_03870 [Proteobacteria bacterium]|nr:hypothetical protein [Pseudomonadota bacterium]MBU1233036.1 hypothetical protein [Pseudomonadota bacterium]MBU1418467.1 hypothetical protein [Pseudomonadota bacterium]MBU1453843.1 hypothetical protein [Pseudomonadota bacterium]